MDCYVSSYNSKENQLDNRKNGNCSFKSEKWSCGFEWGHLENKVRTKSGPGFGIVEPMHLITT